jgi:malonyl CoA-acyl carrier protein transacylase
MSEAQAAFREFMNRFRFSEPSLTVISNVEARPYDARRVVSLLAEQLTSPVKWAESIQYLRQHGVEEFVETGPGTVLSGLVAAITKGAGERGARPISSHSAS